MLKCTIYGERCSGTNYLEELLVKNFDVNITWEYGWKHFFGFDNLKKMNTDNTLFLCIIRNPVDWINSFYREMHHLPRYFKNIPNEQAKIQNFLNNTIWSTHPNGSENLKDRNIYTGKRYKNIFESRYIKTYYLLNILPNMVKNYIFIRYEDILNDFQGTMNKIREKGLSVKKKIKFPVNVKSYKKEKNKIYIQKKNVISKNEIFNNPNFIPLFKSQEARLEYI